MFGGDRGSGNRHYPNIASLADIHYQSMDVGGSAASLTWNADTVDEIVKRITLIWTKNHISREGQTDSSIDLMYRIFMSVLVH
jgi:hypothetical protein